MQEIQTNKTVLAKFERVRVIFDRLEDNALVPLEIMADTDYGCNDFDWRAQNAVFFMEEMATAIDDLAEAIGVKPREQPVTEAPAIIAINPAALTS